MKSNRTKSRYTYLGTLMAGDWHFGLIEIEGQEDVILVRERTGKDSPRLILRGRMLQLGEGK